MKMVDFTYDLPEELIASEPPAIRGDARLLTLDRSSGDWGDQRYGDFVNYLSAGDLVILNDTKVISARLMTHKKSSGAIRELVLLESHGQKDSWHQHRALYRGRLSQGDVLVAGDGTELVVEDIIGEGVAKITSDRDLLDLADKIGETPLPPYLHRAATAQDKLRYQTLWAKIEGSVAAPTASLNLNDQIMTALKAKKVQIGYATLHVGLGTFLPIRTDNIEDHVMHKEYFFIPARTVNAIRSTKAQGKKVVAIGTTITRTLEYSAAEILSPKTGDLQGEADIFIYPGYEFKIIDALLTNFHAPETTVLMLAAAFAGWDNLKKAYEQAVKMRYRFLSYGDSMFIYSGNNYDNDG
jgi:S-adenosylmethionine:tRNA ribosyltransferase-isomerase